MGGGGNKRMDKIDLFILQGYIANSQYGQLPVSLKCQPQGREEERPWERGLPTTWSFPKGQILKSNREIKNYAYGKRQTAEMTT